MRLLTGVVQELHETIALRSGDHEWRLTDQEAKLITDAAQAFGDKHGMKRLEAAGDAVATGIIIMRVWGFKAMAIRNRHRREALARQSGQVVHLVPREGVSPQDTPPASLEGAPAAEAAPPAAPPPEKPAPFWARPVDAKGRFTKRPATAAEPGYVDAGSSPGLTITPALPLDDEHQPSGF